MTDHKRTKSPAAAPSHAPSATPPPAGDADAPLSGPPVDIATFARHTNRAPRVYESDSSTLPPPPPIQLDEPLLSVPPRRDAASAAATPAERDARSGRDPAARFTSTSDPFFPAAGAVPSLFPLAAQSMPPPFSPLPVTPPNPPAESARERLADPRADMRDRYSLGDYSGALSIAEGLLASAPTDAEVAECAEHCRDVLAKMYAARLGPLDRVPFVVVARNQLHWLSLDHRAGFVLSHIDGISTLDMILDVSGMAHLDCLRILNELFQQRVIAFR